MPASGAIPPAREYHTSISNTAQTSLFVFGGRNGATFFNDLYRYDVATSTWFVITPFNSGPSPRAGHTADYIESENMMVIYGGQLDAAGTVSDQMWKFDFSMYSKELSRHSQ